MIAAESIFYIVLAVMATLFVLYFTVFMVHQQTAAIVERFGKFVKVSEPGLNFKIPFIEWVVGRPSLRVKQLDVPVESKTRDNVFVNLSVSVQYRITPENVKSAFYELNEPELQIRSFVFDVVRAEVPKLELDEVFEKKDDIANAIDSELTDLISRYGFNIVKALVTDIDPEPNVKAAMNTINEKKRLRIAAEEEGQAAKILAIKAAEGEAESKRLQGLGVANQRAEIIKGMVSNIKEMQDVLPENAIEQAHTFVLLTTHYDTLQAIGAKSNSNVLMIDPTPKGMTDTAQDIRNAVVNGGLVTQSTQNK